MLIPEKSSRARLLAVGLLAASGAAAVAQEFCVVCTGPSAMYRCTIDNYRPGAAPNLGALCTEQMARFGGHGSCLVGKGITVLDCKGPLMRVDIAKPSAPVVTDSAVQDAKNAKAKSETGEPKTVLDMIKRAQGKPAAEPAEPVPAAPAATAAKPTDAKAAKAAPPSVQAKPNPLADTWRCMSSLFTKCGD